MVRDTLGEDAIILATREERGGKAVRVTAAIDPNDYDDRSYGEPAFETHGHTQPSSADTWLQYDDEQEDGAVAEEVTDAMLRHAVPEDVMDQILSCATVVGFEQPGVALVAALEHLFQFSPLPQKATDKALMFIGPPGSGKTLAVAKAAARGAMNGLKMGVITTDTVRAGGVEQLASFTKLLRINLKKADGPAQLHEQIQSLKACDQILIDTSGINPFDTNDIRSLAKLIGADEIEPHLVLAAGMDAEESGEMGRVFATIGAHKLMPSRIDMARRLGGILSAAHHGAMSFCDAANTPKVADGLLPMTPKTLAKLLMPQAYKDSVVNLSETSDNDSAASGSSSKRRAGTHQ